MKKQELLSPAGNKESLYMAVHAGADAVYLSGKKYGARKFANNFSDEEIIEAINYCHLYGVRVYVTLNTLIFESEVDDFIFFARMLYLNNVDAVIVQDIGMIKLLRKVLPDLEIHASTQTHNYNIETTKMYKQLGAKRVVLARELSLDEISEHSKIMDTEVFIHGALCMAYSGCCYMSLLRGGRSGNRGECAGTCRLPYDSKSDNKYVLSTKDLCNIYDIDKIINTNTKSLKIEGRMKSKEYVYLVTKLYRDTLDKYYLTGKLEVNEEIFNDIKKVFNREYTNGHKFGANDIMNPKRPNHQGVEIGQVIDVDNKYITIKLTSDLVCGDGIKFNLTDTGFTVTNIYINGNKVTEAKKNQIISVRNTIDLKSLSKVVKTSDKTLIDSLKNIKEKKIKIDCNIKIKDNIIEVEYVDDANNIVKKQYDVVQKSIKISTSKEEIIKQLSKLGNTPFEIRNTNINNIGNIFINIKDLNSIRRELIDELSLKRTSFNRKVSNISYDNSFSMNNNNIEISASVVNEEQYKILKKLNIDNIYTENYELYKKYESENIYYILPRIINKPYDNIKRIVINDYNYIPESSDIIGNYYLNITNTYSCKYLYDIGVKKICVSPDLNKKYLAEILDRNNSINFEVQIYGSYEVMITKNKPVADTYFRNNDYKYEIKNHGNYISILNSPVNRINVIKEYARIGIRKFRLDFNNETENDIHNIVSEVKKEIKEILPF